MLYVCWCQLLMGVFKVVMAGISFRLRVNKEVDYSLPAPPARGENLLTTIFEQLQKKLKKIAFFFDDGQIFLYYTMVYLISFFA